MVLGQKQRSRGPSGELNRTARSQNIPAHPLQASMHPFAEPGTIVKIDARKVSIRRAGSPRPLSPPRSGRVISTRRRGMIKGDQELRCPTPWTTSIPTFSMVDRQATSLCRGARCLANVVSPSSRLGGGQPTGLCRASSRTGPPAIRLGIRGWGRALAQYRPDPDAEAHRVEPPPWLRSFDAAGRLEPAHVAHQLGERLESLVVQYEVGGGQVVLQVVE